MNSPYQIGHMLTFLFLAMATPALAEVDGTMQSRMSILPGEGLCFAIVRIENRAGFYNRVDHLETEEGTVSIEYETVGGHNPNDDDLIRVVSLPMGVLAQPLALAIPDDEMGFICLIKWIGG